MQAVERRCLSHTTFTPQQCKKLMRALEERGVTVAELARDAELHPDTIYSALDGKPIRLSTKRKLVMGLMVHQRLPDLDSN